MSEMTYKVLYNMLMEHEGERMRKLKALELPEYRHIPWVKDFSCPQCGKDEWSHEGWKARPIGWCNTPEGYMGIFECPECFAKMRWHISTAGRWNKEMFLTDLKTVMGANSVGNRLEDSKSQANRAVLNMATTYNPRRLGEAIRHYFDNPMSVEVIIFKGKREISIKREDITNDFIKYFIRIYTK